MSAWVRDMFLGRERDRGFTLVELLIVILIVGILAAVAVPLYLGYTRDARSAEGKALAGSALTALQGCVQAKGGGQSCARSEVEARIGVNSAGRTGDGRWEISSGTSLSVSSSSPPTFGGSIGVSGVGTDNNGIGIGMHVSATGIALRCTLTSSTPPASATAGEAC